MSEDPDEPDVVVDEKDPSVDKLNQHLPEGVYYDEDDQQLIVHGQKYDVKKVVSQLSNQAKGRGPATFGLTIGGVTLGILIAGPFVGAAAATFGAVIGALYDKEYIEFGEDGLKLNIGGESEHIDPEEAEVTDPFEVHNDKWYVPDSDTYQVAVELPDGDRRYYKTEEGAANRLIREYES